MEPLMIKDTAAPKTGSSPCWLEAFDKAQFASTNRGVWGGLLRFMKTME